MSELHFASSESIVKNDATQIYLNWRQGRLSAASAVDGLGQLLTRRHTTLRGDARIRVRVREQEDGSNAVSAAAPADGRTVSTPFPIWC